MHLNVGSRAGYRNIGVSDIDEAYYVEDLGSSDRGRTIKVSAYGRSNVIKGVTSIHANFKDGNDLIFLGRTEPGGNGVVTGIPTIPVFIDMGSGNDGVSYGGSSSADIKGGDGDDYIEIVGTGTATVEAGNGNDFIIHQVGDGIGRGVTIKGGNGDDKFIGGISTDKVYGEGGGDDISGPAQIIDSGSGDDLVTLEMVDQLVSADIKMGGSTNDTLNLWGTVNDDQIDITEAGSQLKINFNPIQVDISGVKQFNLYAAAGSDTITLNGVTRTNLSGFTIDLGQRMIQQGTRTESETIGSGDEAETFSREVPNYVFYDDGSSDTIEFIGSSGNDVFNLNSAGQLEGGAFTTIDVQAAINIQQADNPKYRTTISNSVRSEGDKLVIDS